jgi:hypothetical protein
MPTIQVPAGQESTTAVVLCALAFCDSPPPEPSRIFAVENVRAA